MAKNKEKMPNLNMVLRKLRVFHDFSQRDMCAATGFSQALISEIESGNKAVSVEKIAAYSKVFNVSQASILWLAENFDNPSVEEDVPIGPKMRAVANLLAVIK